MTSLTVFYTNNCYSVGGCDLGGFMSQGVYVPPRHNRWVMTYESYDRGLCPNTTKPAYCMLIII